MPRKTRPVGSECARCGEPTEPARRVLLCLVPVKPGSSFLSAVVSAPSFVLCASCAATVGNCLARGTGLSPIVLPRGRTIACLRPGCGYVGRGGLHACAAPHGRGDKET